MIALAREGFLGLCVPAALGGNGAREADRPRAGDHGVFHGIQIKLRSTNQMLAGRSARRRMYQANHAVP